LALISIHVLLYTKEEEIFREIAFIQVLDVMCLIVRDQPEWIRKLQDRQWETAGKAHLQKGMGRGRQIFYAASNSFPGGGDTRFAR